jgi:lysophospholipase L1-like esterase
MSGKIRRVTGNLFLVLASLFLTLAALEWALRRVLPPPIVWIYPQEEYIYDPEVNYVLKPSQQAYTHDKTVSINSHGIRDVEYSPNPPGDVTRIVALGDSQTFGNGLSEPETWPKRLEYYLRGKGGGHRWEVINCGVPATDTWQHEILLERLLADFHPQIVVLALYVNDVGEKYLDANPHGEPYKVGLAKRIGYYLKRSVLLMTIRGGFQQLKQRVRPSHGFELENAVITGAPVRGLDAAWAQVDQSLGRMTATCKARRVQFLVVVLPRRDMVAAQDVTFAYNKRLQQIGEKYSIPMVDVLQPLREAYVQHGQNLFIAWDGHNSASANTVVAENTLRKLQEMGLAR